VYWNDLPLAMEDIERIEVIRGPNAAIHGANAFAAVINIITKTAAQVPGTFISTQLGEESMGGLIVRHGGGNDSLRYRLTLSTQSRDRFERDVTYKSIKSQENGAYYEASQTAFLNGRLDWQSSASSDVSLQFGLSQGDRDAGRDIVDPLGVLEPREQDSRAFYVQLAYHKVESLQREWRLNAYFSRNRFDANALVDLGGLGIGVVDVNQYLSQSRSNVELQVNETWSANLRGVWGAEIRQDKVVSPQNYYASGARSGALARAFANAEWRVHERVLLQGGAMLEHHYFTDTDISPRAAVSFTLHPGHVLRMGLSQAFRSPTFFEEDGNQVFLLDTGAVADWVTVPSLGLRPERVRSREIAYLGQWRPARLELDVRLYRDHIDDFIGTEKDDFVADGTLRENEFRYANIGTVDAHGGEIQLRWHPTSQWDISAHYARVYLDADTSVSSFNKDIPLSAPRNSWGLLASYRLGSGWEASVGAWHYDDTKWLSEGDLVQNHTRIDARLARRWTWQGREVEAALVGQNLGEDYTEFRDTNIFSRRVYGSVSLAW
jgi:iron complex outermembrane receptor protein